MITTAAAIAVVTTVTCNDSCSCSSHIQTTTIAIISHQ